jgi:hypothetical protein
MLLNSALTGLKNTSDNLPPQWTALSSQPAALRMLVLHNPVRSRGDVAAHASAQRLIGKSVLALTVEQEQKDMTAILRAVYGAEPNH